MDLCQWEFCTIPCVKQCSWCDSMIAIWSGTLSACLALLAVLGESRAQCLYHRAELVFHGLNHAQRSLTTLKVPGFQFSDCRGGQLLEHVVLCCYLVCSPQVNLHVGCWDSGDFPPASVYLKKKSISWATWSTVKTRCISCTRGLTMQGQYQPEGDCLARYLKIKPSTVILDVSWTLGKKWGQGV